MQLASYLPIINIEFPADAGEFSSKIAEVVTFEIPGLDLDLLGDFIECPEDDGYLSDIREEPISDETTIRGERWSELKKQYLLDPYFDSLSYLNALDEGEKKKIIRLSEAQEKIGYENPLPETEGRGYDFIAGLDLLSF